MFLSTWLRNRKKSLASWLAQQQTRRQRSNAHPLARTLLCLEVLEDRIAPHAPVGGFQSLYSFTGGSDGANPLVPVIVDSNGNLDGTTSTGKVTFGAGSVFQFNPSNKGLTVLHTFSTSGAYYPAGGVIQDSGGNFYGTTVYNSNGDGTVFRISSDGTFTIIHNFKSDSSEGMDPSGELVMDGKGNIYGTTQSGGAHDDGTVFQLSPNGSGGYNLTTLYAFNGNDGWVPSFNLVLDSSGNLYGVTQLGPSGHGTVFELGLNGTGGYDLSTLHIFAGGVADGAEPDGGLVMDGKGNLYGSTLIGGTSNEGVVFKLNPSSGAYSIIYNFAFPQGYAPSGNLVVDSQDNLYGVTQNGGTSNAGTVYELSPIGSGYTYTTLHSFSGSDGSDPLGALTADSNGNLYGTTIHGGANNDGTIFEIAGAINTHATSTTATNAQAYFSPNTQSVKLTATVSGAVAINEGTVTFEVLQNGTLIGQATTSSTVSNGQASVSYALPANLLPGAYTIDAVYSGGPDFSDSSDSAHTLTVSPASVTTTALSFSATYDNTTSQNLQLNATVADDSISTDTVSEGMVKFTVEDSGGNMIGTASGAVSGGKASANFTLPQAQAAGNYTIVVGFKDSSGNFVDGGDNSGTLTVDPSNADITANNVQTTYSSQQQTVKLTASVADDINPIEIIGEGAVTFTVKNSSGVTLGTLQGNVSNGAASADLTLAAGQAPGSYVIGVSYNDSLDNFNDFQDSPGTLTISPASVTTTALSFSATYDNTTSQNLQLKATVADDSISTDTVNEGMVKFTVEDSIGNTLGSVSGAVSGGTASANFTLPQAQPAGKYTIVVSYKDSSGDFVDGGDNTGILTVDPSPADATASNVQTAYSSQQQTVKLTASVADDIDPIEAIGEGVVTFTVKDSSGVTLSTLQGNVSSGAASAKFALPGGQLPGDYTIDVGYTDSLGNFTDFTDTPGKLSVNSASVTVTASDASTVYQAGTQSLKFTAAIADTSFPSDTVSEGTVTFTVKDSSGNQVGNSVTATVSSGTASAYFPLSGGQAAGSYVIDVGYEDPAGKFANYNTTAALTIASANVTASANKGSAAYRPSSQALSLSATVSDASVPGDKVNEGTVTFTILDSNGNQIGNTVSAAVSNGIANTQFSWPAGQAAGTYTIAVSYSDSKNASGAYNFSDNGKSDESATLTIGPAKVAATALAANLTFNPNTQSVTLNANLADTSYTGDPIGEGTVTFTIEQVDPSQTIVVGTATAAVTAGTSGGGTASTSFTWTAGRAAGAYTILVSYADTLSSYIDSGDTSSTLAVATAPVTVAASNASEVYSLNSQNVTFNATVSGTEDAGAVVFTVKNRSTIVGTAQGEVSDGAAFANFTLPGGLAAGSYTLAVSYIDMNGNYRDAGDANGTLTIAPANVVTTANTAPVASDDANTVTLSASVVNASNPGDSVGEGTVTFIVTDSNGNRVGNSVTDAVSNGTASASFSLKGVAAGSYIVAVSYSDSQNANGAVNFSDNGKSDTSGTLVLIAATVTTNPSDQTANVGNKASFTAAANGNPTPTVQWQVSTDGGNTFTDINGATSTTLTINKVQTSQNGNKYQAVFTNSLGTATTAAATLTVPVAPTVTANPSNLTAAAGSTAAFTAAANGGPEPMVQWKVSTDGGATWNDISGATSTTLMLTNLQASQNGYEYQAVFTNSTGSVTTSAATLTVQFAPTVTTNPSSQTVAAGREATFTAAANGDPAPSVQWQVSTDRGKTFTDISGAISTTLTLTGLTTAMSGNEYQAIFTNSQGSVTTSPATLTVNLVTVPVITVNPTSQTATAGTSVLFTVSATGDPEPTVQWQVSTNGGTTFGNITGATNPTLTLTDVNAAMNGWLFQAVVNNSAGTVVSDVATLNVSASSPPSSSSISPSVNLNVPPLLALLGGFISGIATINANNTETVVYSLFGIALVTANYDGSGNFLDATLFGLSIPNWVWNL